MEEDNDNSKFSTEETCVTSKDDYSSNKLTDSTNIVSTNDKQILLQDEENTIENDEENDENTALQIGNDPINKTEDDKTTFRSCQIALSRIKTIMKLDPDLGLVSKESLYLITKATELFIEFLSKESYKFTSQGSRKTIQKKDIDSAINQIDSLCFLDAALD